MILKGELNIYYIVRGICYKEYLLGDIESNMSKIEEIAHTYGVDVRILKHDYIKEDRLYRYIHEYKSTVGEGLEFLDDLVKYDVVIV